MTSPTTGFIIVERFGAPVCVLKWHGTRTKGRGELSKTESASDEDMRAAYDAMDSHKELSKVRFHRSGGWSYGWHGFDGIVAALRIALPPFGLAIGEIHWPEEEGRWRR